MLAMYNYSRGFMIKQCLLIRGHPPFLTLKTNFEPGSVLTSARPAGLQPSVSSLSVEELFGMGKSNAETPKRVVSVWRVPI